MDLVEMTTFIMTLKFTRVEAFLDVMIESESIINRIRLDDTYLSRLGFGSL